MSRELTAIAQRGHSLVPTLLTKSEHHRGVAIARRLWTSRGLDPEHARSTLAEPGDPVFVCQRSQTASEVQGRTPMMHCHGVAQSP